VCEKKKVFPSGEDDDNLTIQNLDRGKEEGEEHMEGRRRKENVWTRN
jgi:hypothetical protein